jgi:hypothetical protein
VKGIGRLLSKVLDEARSFLPITMAFSRRPRKDVYWSVFMPLPPSSHLSFFFPTSDRAAATTAAFASRWVMRPSFTPWWAAWVTHETYWPWL